MDRSMAGVLVKAQTQRHSAGEAYSRITARINAFKGMPRARFDALWREVAAARPTGKFGRPYDRFAQWLTNLGHRPAGFKPTTARPAAGAPARTTPTRTVSAARLGELTAADRAAIARARAHVAEVRAAAESRRVRNWLLTGTY